MKASVSEGNFGSVGSKSLEEIEGGGQSTQFAENSPATAPSGGVDRKKRRKRGSRGGTLPPIAAPLAPAAGSSIVLWQQETRMHDEQMQLLLIDVGAVHPRSNEDSTIGVRLLAFPSTPPMAGGGAPSAYKTKPAELFLRVDTLMVCVFLCCFCIFM